MEEEIADAAASIKEAGTAVAFTGAGVSTASGIPDFRSEGGIWEKYDPETFRLHYFQSNPGEFWRTWLELRRELGDPEPNPAHNAIADMYRDGFLDAVVTQNVDGLHQDAGVARDDVVELHGNSGRAVCRECRDRKNAARLAETLTPDSAPPRCDCGGLLKPDTVLFGERLPEHALMRAHALAEKADALLVAGSSLTVEPAASLPGKAKRTGADLVIVNLDETPLSGSADHAFTADVTKVIPRLKDKLP